MLTPEQEKDLRAAHEAYPHGLHTSEGCLYVEYDCVGTIRHGDDECYWSPDDSRLASRLVKCSRHMPAALDTITALRAERDELRERSRELMAAAESLGPTKLIPALFHMDAWKRLGDLLAKHD